MDFVTKNDLLALIQGYAANTAKNVMYTDIANTRDVEGNRDGAHKYMQKARYEETLAANKYRLIKDIIDKA